MSEDSENYRYAIGDYIDLQELETALSEWELITHSSEPDPAHVKLAEVRMVRSRGIVQRRLTLLTQALVLANPKCGCGAPAACFSRGGGREFSPSFFCNAHCDHDESQRRCGALDVPPDHYAKQLEKEEDA